METEELQPLGWHEYRDGRWTLCTGIADDDVNADADADADATGVATYNAWFNEDPETHPFHRMDGIIAAITGAATTLQTTIIGLQEVTPNLLTYILENETLQTSHCVSHVDINPYGVVLLMPKTLTHAFPTLSLLRYTETTMDGREAVLAYGTGRVVGVTHLDSKLHNTHVRKAQMSQLLDVVDRLDPSTVWCCLMGDWNHHIEAPVDDLIVQEGGLKDAWDALHAGESSGLTMDTTTNTMLAADKAPKEMHVRFDRIYLSPSITPTAAVVIGTSPLPSLPHTYPSDHYGLYIAL